MKKSIKAPTLYRQGDVLIIAASPKVVAGDIIPRDNGRVVLAYGEVTGHAHAIHDSGAELRTLPDTDDRFLRIMDASGVSLQHEEHDTIALPPGDYIVRIQREYTPEAIVRVVD